MQKMNDCQWEHWPEFQTLYSQLQQISEICNPAFCNADFLNLNLQICDSAFCSCSSFCRMFATFGSLTPEMPKRIRNRLAVRLPVIFRMLCRCLCSLQCLHYSIQESWSLHVINILLSDI